MSATHRTERFEVRATPKVTVRMPAADVRVRPGPEGVVEVEVLGPSADAVEISAHGDRILVELVARGRFGREAKHEVLLTVPPATDLEVRIGTGAVSADVPLGTVDGALGAGDVRLGAVERTDLKAGSGDVWIGRLAARGRIVTGAGDVTVDEALGDLHLATGSGDLTVGRAEADVEARTASGDVVVERVEGRRVSVKTVSGDARIGVPRGREVTVDATTLSGSVRLPEASEGDGPAAGGRPLDIAFKAVSGDLEVAIVGA